MADVFISYKKEDRALAERVEAALKRAGYSVWWDDSLTPRESWDAIIQREIADAAAVVVIWTPRSVQSEWVRIEANYGKQNGKLVPLLAEPCDIPLAFSLTQAAILTGWDGAPGHGEWQKALGWIAALKADTDGPDPLPEESAVAAPPTAPASPPSPPRPWARYGLAGLGLAMVAGIGATMLTGRENVPVPDELSSDTEPAPPAEARVEPLAPQPGETFRDCTDCPEMVVLPQGSFIMGSPPGEEGRDDDEGPLRTVRIGYALAVGKYEVTWDQWNACVAGGECDNAGPVSEGGDEGWGIGARPVINVSWNDAQAYVAWLGVQTGETYRLLREAEWEYAARGVTSPTQAHTRFSWGEDDPVCERGAPNGAVFWTCDGRGTEPVGFSAANPFGLHDMHGNVYEWVEDCYVDSYDEAPMDGSARSVSDCSRRVLRGGSWGNDPRGLRSAGRSGIGPRDRSSGRGFRVARTLSPPSP